LEATRTTTPGAGLGARLPALTAIVLTVLAALQLWSLMRFEPVGMDFLPLWAAGEIVWTAPHKVYDFAAVTAAQAFMLPPHFAWLRPYPYPPTTLLLLAPLGRLQFWAADAIWSALSLGVFITACLRLATRSKALGVLITLAMPAVVIAASAGQTVVLAGGLLVLAVIELQHRPWLAGALFGLVAIVKPQAALMAPVALLACGAFEALASAGIVTLVAVIASALLFGPERWTEWLASLPAFQQVVESVPRLGSAVITPLWAARELGLRGLGAALPAALFGLGGAVLVWSFFRKPAAPAFRVGALAIGSLVATPYAMCYDGALFAPAAVTLAIAGLQRGQLVVPLLMLASAYEVTANYLGLLALLVFGTALVVAWRTKPAAAGSDAVALAPSGSTP
jgi:hypothetical protein